MSGSSLHCLPCYLLHIWEQVIFNSVLSLNPCIPLFSPQDIHPLTQTLPVIYSSSRQDSHFTEVILLLIFSPAHQQRGAPEPHPCTLMYRINNRKIVRTKYQVLKEIQKEIVYRTTKQCDIWCPRPDLDCILSNISSVIPLEESFGDSYSRVLSYRKGFHVETLRQAKKLQLSSEPSEVPQRPLFQKEKNLS